MKGFEAGTKVIITCKQPEAEVVRLGQIVTVGAGVEEPGVMSINLRTRDRRPNKHWMQELVDVRPKTTRRYMHRIDWMRKLEDPGETEKEVSREMVNVSGG